MNKQLNIRCLCALALLFALLSVLLTVGSTYGRYLTRESNVFRCIASPADKLYVEGLTAYDASDTDGSLELSRDGLTAAPEWESKGGEQYVTFTVSNSAGEMTPGQDISFRIRVLIPLSDESSENSSIYSTLNFVVDSDSGRHYSQIDTVNPKTALAKGDAGLSGGWLFKFYKTPADEVTYTLKGGTQDEISITLSVMNTELDCSDVIVYVDRVN